MDNIFCIECGFELPSTAKFCLKCGGKIPEIVISDSKITKEENIESESKPITQTPIKTTSKTSKAMAIGTTLLEWIIIFAVALLIAVIAGFVFGTRTSSIVGFIAFLISRAVIRSILKSILPQRYKDETEGEVKNNNEFSHPTKNSKVINQWIIISAIVLITGFGLGLKYGIITGIYGFLFFTIRNIKPTSNIKLNNNILRFYYGEISLVKSYWLISFPIIIFNLIFISFVLSYYGFGDYFRFTDYFFESKIIVSFVDIFLFYFLGPFVYFFLTLPLFIYIFIGLWNSANNSIKNNSRNFWITITKIQIMLTIIGIIIIIPTQLYYWYYFSNKEIIFYSSISLKMMTLMIFVGGFYLNFSGYMKNVKYSYYNNIKLYKNLFSIYLILIIISHSYLWLVYIANDLLN